MDLQTSLIDLESIESIDQGKFSFNPNLKAIEIDYLAKAIVNLKGLLRIPVVEQVAIDSYKLIAGHFDYYAYLKARTIDSSLPDRIRVFIVNPKKETAKGILEQLEAIDRLGGDFGSAGLAKNPENNPENDPAKDPIDQALNQTLKSIANTINFEVLERFSQIEKKLDQLEEKVDRSADLIDSLPPPESRSQSIEQNVAQNLGQNLGQNLEKSLSELITRLAQGQLQATIELKTPPETLTVKEILPPQIQNLKEIYEELSLASLKKLAKKRKIDLASLLSKPLTKMSTADRPAIIGKMLAWHQNN